MQIEVEVVKPRPYFSKPKPNVNAFRELFEKWGLDDYKIEKLKLHISFITTEVRGEYLGCRDGVHYIEILDLYLFEFFEDGRIQHFLNQVTVHELRHLWWAIQENTPADFGELDCQAEEKKHNAQFWTLEKVEEVPLN